MCTSFQAKIRKFPQSPAGKRVGPGPRTKTLPMAPGPVKGMRSKTRKRAGRRRQKLKEEGVGLCSGSWTPKIVWGSDITASASFGKDTAKPSPSAIASGKNSVLSRGSRRKARCLLGFPAFRDLRCPPHHLRGHHEPLLDPQRPHPLAPLCWTIVTRILRHFKSAYVGGWFKVRRLYLWLKNPELFEQLYKRALWLNLSLVKICPKKT